MKVYKTIYKLKTYKEGLLHDESIKHTDTSDFHDLKLFYARLNDNTMNDESFKVIKLVDIIVDEENESDLNEFINNMYYMNKKVLRYEESEKV